MMFDNGLEKIWRTVTSDEGSERIVEAYPSIFEIWATRFRIGLASR